jgi:thiosulfate/3-mercaptopyruvate sulfurtransferase
MRRSLIRSAFLAVAVAAVLAMPVHAQKVREEMLVSPDWLQRRLGIVTILHIGDAATYRTGHIPGAVLIERTSLVVDRNGTPNELPPTDVLERLFRNAGVGARGRVVVYSTDPLLAARAWFTLDYLGQGSRVSILDGGLTKWVSAGYAITSQPSSPERGSFEARPAAYTITRLAAMRQIVRLREQFGHNLVLIDARSHEQYCGGEAGTGVPLAGHIPGAVNVPYTDNLDGSGSLKSVADLRMLYLQAGLTRNSANIVYCRTGMQASMTYFVLRYLGYDATLYDGSFIEWSNAGELIA